MQIIPVRHIEDQSINCIESRFSQVAEHQGLSSQQLKLSLMERYVNQWLCKNELMDIVVCDADNDFRRKLRKPIPVFVHVDGLTSSMGPNYVPFSLPYYEVPYEHCRVISDEPFRFNTAKNNINIIALLKPGKELQNSLVWQGYIQVFDPKYFTFPHRVNMIESVKKELSVNVRKAINISFPHSTQPGERAF